MKPILTDLYQKWMSDGELFTMMGVRHVTPWAEETDGKVLDLEYFGNRSGSKIVAPLLEKMLTEAGLSDEAKQNIVDLIWIRFGRNWAKLWETLTVEYNPIENYRMTEKGKIDHDGDQSNGVYGFNSTASVPSGTGHDEYIDNTELTRSGNIGVTTSQQMIQSERDLWVWKFFEQVFQDVDTVLSIDVYGQSCLGDFSEYHGGGSEYVLPPATATTLGGIKVGDHLSITPDGRLSAEGGGEYELPPATAATLGGVKIGEGLNVTEDGTISVQGGEAPVTSVNGKSGAVILNYDDVGAPSLAEFQQIEDDTEQNTQDIVQIMTDVPFRFGVDADGNYGYYKAGADTVTPFLSGGGASVKGFTGVFRAGVPLDMGDTVNTIHSFAYAATSGVVNGCMYVYAANYDAKKGFYAYRVSSSSNATSYVNDPESVYNVNPSGGSSRNPFIGISSDGIIKSALKGSYSYGLADTDYIITVCYE